VGTIVAERAFDVVCLALVFILAFALQFDVIGEYGIGLLKTLFLNKTGSFDPRKFIIALVIIVVAVIIIRVLFKRYAEAKIVKSIRSILTGVLQGIVSVKDLKHKWEFLFCSLGIWAMYLLGTWIGFGGTVGSAGLPLKVAVSGLAFASVGMIVTPGGIGAYAFFLAKVLEKNGVPFEIGFANGTMQWFAQFLIIVFAGFISLGLLPVFNRKNKKHEEAGRHSIENTNT
jgi:hypothetical protein